MTAQCPSCATRLDHCHGTLLAHRDGALDCTDPLCADPDPLRHDLVADCEIVGGCATCAPLPALAGVA